MPLRQIAGVTAALLLVILAGYGLTKVISTNTVRHEDCLTGYRVLDC